jgi:hypothetical protein
MQYLKLADYIIFLGALTGLALYRRLHSTAIKILVWLLVVTLFVELATPFKIISFSENNYLLYNIFTPVECSLYALMYHVSLSNKTRKNFILSVWLIAICLMLANMLLVQGIKPFNSYSFIISCVAITLFAFTYLLQQYSAEVDLRFYQQPLFLVSIGILFFYPAAIVGSGLITELYVWNKQLAIGLYKINGILNAVTYTIFLAAIIIDSRKWTQNSK